MLRHIPAATITGCRHTPWPHMHDYQRLDVHLDEQLRRSELTVAELAAAIGITPANVFVLKNGRAKAVRFTTLAAICEVLACQPADILTYRADDDGTASPGVLSE